MKQALKISAAFVLIFAMLTGCAAKDQQATSAPSANTENKAEKPKEDTKKSEPKQAPQPDWETQVYEDDYLRYEIPANWVKNESYSNNQMRLSFFTEKEAKTETPSNVNIQVLHLNNSNGIDYADPQVQKEFHEFLLSPDGLPQKEAQNGVYAVEQINDIWVYSLSFPRDAGNGTIVQQTVYFPMGLDHSIVIWATDFKDNCTPTVTEIAKHICATLQLKA